MTTTAGDVLVETPARLGRGHRVRACPGTASTGSWRRCARGRTRSASSRSGTRRAAAFMACGYAKWTGRLGVCLATSGPGGIHLLNGLYDAKLDGAPVLAITGLQFHDLIGDLHPAGRRARQAVHGRGRLQRADHGAGACAQRGRARLPHGASLSRRGACHHAGRPAVRAGQGRAAALGAQHRGARRLRAAGGRARRLPGEDQLARAAAILNAEQEALHPGRARGAGGRARP